MSLDRNKIRSFWNGFWQLADIKIWIASTVPMIVGAALAYGITGRIHLYWLIVSMIGIYCIEIGKNAVNEIVDYISGVDRFVTPKNRTPVSGGKKTSVDGKLTLFETGLIAVFTFGLAGLIGLYIVFFRERSVLYVGLAGVIISIIYSVPPFKLSYRGFGEVAVGVTFGPLILSGMYLVMANSFDIRAILVSIPIGLLIANVLWINQFPDYEADMQGGKKNWVVRLGKKRSVKVYQWIFTAAYVCFLLMSILLKNWLWLLGFLTVPIAYQAVETAKLYYNDIPNLQKANAKTVQIYIATGIIMTIAALFQ